MWIYFIAGKNNAHLKGNLSEMEVSVTFIVCYFYTSTFHILSLQ